MKTVLFTQRMELVTAYNERRDCADQRIALFIEKCGFLPVPCPNNPDIAVKLVDYINPAGIVLTGGNSLVKYGGNAPERDATDKQLIETAIAKKIPLYGFCRGMQSILDYFGNELTNVSGHVAVKHQLNDGRTVNSFHNQACVELSNDELVVSAKSEDGVIEEVHHRLYSFWGTMWHPEREDPFIQDDIIRVQGLFGNKK